MAFTEAQLTELQENYAKGITRVTFNGRTIEYRSLRDMQTVISKLEQDLSGERPTRQYRVNVSKGI